MIKASVIALTALTLIASAGTTSAHAETASKVSISGTIGNMDENSVEVNVRGGIRLKIPRKFVRSREQDIRPDHKVVAVVNPDEVQILPSLPRKH